MGKIIPLGTNRHRYVEEARNKSAGIASFNEHAKLLIPQTVVDGWQCLCSCGAGWFASYYEFDKKDDLLNALAEAHAEHVKEVHNG